MEDYIASLENSSLLLDKLSKHSYTSDTQSRELFSCHLTPVEVHDGVSSGKLLQGTFLASRENFLEGNVNVEGREKPVSDIYMFIDILMSSILILSILRRKILNIYFENALNK